MRNKKVIIPIIALLAVAVIGFITYILLKDAGIIDSASDGIKSTEDSDASLGYIVVDGGKLNITATDDAINSISRISITDGDFNITTGGGAGNTSATYNEWGRWQSSSSNDTSTSAKGLKAEKYIIIANGTFNFDTSDDAIHSNASIVINDGNITIKTGDDAIHGDTAITINNGNINIAQSHEGIESSTITINNGNISIVDDDDGLNASGGNDGSSTNGRPGQNNFSNSKGAIYINGSTLAINSRGDGIDSNGSIEMTGGYVTVDGPTDNGNGALDYDGTFKISGGTLIATGASGMLQTPSSDSTQNIISIVFSGSQSANSTFTLKDNSGKTIVDFTPSKSYASIVISTPSISQGESYTASVNNQTITTLTVNDVITSYGAGGGMQGGGMRGGGRR